MVKKHEILFKKIKEVLKKHFPDRLIEAQDGQHLTIRDSNIWIQMDSDELIIGYGDVCNYYNPEQNNLNQAVDRFLSLLTKRKKVTEYLRGEFSYKYEVVIEQKHEMYEMIGTTIRWLFPFWKKKQKKITFQDKLIEPSKLQEEIDDIKKSI